MTALELIKAIQSGRAKVYAVKRGDAARQNVHRPAYVRAECPDAISKALNGKDSKKVPQVFVVVVEPEPLIVTPGIILPGGGR